MPENVPEGVQPEEGGFLESSGAEKLTEPNGGSWEQGGSLKRLTEPNGGSWGSRSRRTTFGAIQATNSGVQRGPVLDPLHPPLDAWSISELILDDFEEHFLLTENFIKATSSIFLAKLRSDLRHYLL